MFRYVWHYDSETTEEIDNWTLAFGGESIETVTQKAFLAAQSAGLETLQQEAANQGISITIESVTPAVSTSERSDGLKTWYRIQISLDFTFTSEQSFIGSPIAPALLAVIYKVIEAVVLAVVAYFVIQAIVDWLKSMTVTTSTVKKYDPVTGQLISEETTTGPTENNLLMVAVIGVMVLVGLMLTRKR